MRLYSLTLRTAITVLGALTSCLLVVSTADAAPVRKAHTRAHCSVCRRVVSPKQAFARIATRRPDRFVRRHITALIRRARTTSHGTGDDAAIQNDISTVSVEADCRPSVALEPIGVLISVQALLKSHEGLARRSPRGPPAFS
jgi:hypothetical protein